MYATITIYDALGHIQTRDTMSVERAYAWQAELEAKGIDSTVTEEAA